MRVLGRHEPRIRSPFEQIIKQQTILCSDKPMKKCHLSKVAMVSCGSVMVLWTGCVSTPIQHESPAAKQHAVDFAPPQDMARVYVFRPYQFAGHLTLYKINLDSQEFGQLGTESYLFGNVPPGDHDISLEVPDAPTVTSHIRAEAGKCYFLQASVGFGRMKMEQLSEEGGRADIEKFNPMGWTASTAVLPSHWGFFKAQVESGGAADCEDENGLTPLFFAARQGDSDIVAFLLAHGADVNHKSKHGETPLMWAASGCGDSRLLVNDSIDSALSCSAYGSRDNLSMVTSLIRAGADINARTERGVTAMGMAALWGNGNIAIWLYEQGANPNVPEKWCEVDGKLAQVLGDYFLAQDRVDKARASFEKARRQYHETVKSVEVQVAMQNLLRALSQVTAVAAAQQMAQVQGRQMAQVAALSRAARPEGGVVVYSTYLQKYNKVYAPTFNSSLALPPEWTQDVETYRNDRIRYYKQLEKLMSETVACFDNYTDLATLHDRVEKLQHASQ
jgi:hypothetical protein